MIFPDQIPFAIELVPLPHGRDDQQAGRPQSRPAPKQETDAMKDLGKCIGCDEPATREFYVSASAIRGQSAEPAKLSFCPRCASVNDYQNQIAARQGQPWPYQPVEATTPVEDWPCWPVETPPAVAPELEPLDLAEGFDANEDQSPMGII